MRMIKTIAFLAVITGPLAVCRADEREQFFESQIRPLLARHCFECHGEKKQESDVRLDRKAFVMKEGAAGPLIVPGKLADSRLWQVIQYEELDVQMPPRGKLPAAELALIKQWIEQGAYWPDDGDAASAHGEGGIPRHADGSIDFVEASASHWAYRPVSNPPVPARTSPHSRTTVDDFVQASLSDAGLSFSPLASRETLIRRMSMDLLGVPPRYEEVQEFVQDQHPDAIARLIDRYLASPLYGQRWGRYWLDIARYADTKGYVFTDNRYFPYSYTYRDYVIRALNEDTPYDQFIVEQLAADRLGLPENDPRLSAMGFLTLGPRFLNREPDIIDDRIDVVCRGLMGMTIGCARCHDHKYDPIPSTDYYSLYGVFNSSYEPEMPPLIGEVDESSPGYQKFAAELKKREQDLSDYITKSHQELLQLATDHVVDCLPAAAKSQGLIPKDTPLKTPHGEQRAKIVEHWKKFIASRVAAKDPVFLPWNSLMSVPDAELSKDPAARLSAVASESKAPGCLLAALQQSPPQSHLEVANVYGRLFEQIAEEWKQLQQQQPPPQQLPDADRDVIRKVLFGPGSISDLPGSENSPLFERDQHDKLRQLHAKITEWCATSPDAPPRAMVLLDKAQPVNPVVFLRGDPRRRGPAVKRHSPRILEPEAEQPFTQGSGRLELARAIASTSNPLTARVLVNRVWSHHFGAGIVSTASDFGTRGNTPTHPELLDHLAWTFMHEDGWSLKALHRRILLSHVYLQQSIDRPEARGIDPENRLLWRQNRQRLDFEALRDCLLAVSGQLDDRLEGRPVNLEATPYSQRRTVYGLIDRNNLPGLLRTFDFPAPDASSPGRPQTTVPQQSLFMMNSPFVQFISQRLAEEIRGHSSETSEQIRQLIREVLSRNASPDEAARLESYLSGHPLDQLSQALLMTNEFMFID